MSKAENIEKEKKTIFAKDIVTKNPVFSVDQITMFFNLFNLYADNRRECNVADIITTAKTLGFDKKHAIVYEGMAQIAQEFEGQWIGFEKFLTALTKKIVKHITDIGKSIWSIGAKSNVRAGGFGGKINPNYWGSSENIGSFRLWTEPGGNPAAGAKHRRAEMPRDQLAEFWRLSG